MKEFQEALYKNFLKSLGDEVLEVPEEKREKVKKGQVRLFLITPPEYVLILDIPEEGLAWVTHLTSYIQFLERLRPPIVEWRGLRLVPVPTFMYIPEDTLMRYSTSVFILKETEPIRDWILTTPRKPGKVGLKFLKKNAKRWKDFKVCPVTYWD